MKKIILDTNFLLIPGSLGVDIFTEIDRILHFPYKLYVLDKTITELEKIILEQKGKHQRAAKLALDLIKAKNINTLQTREDKPVDDILVDLSDEAIIATQDKDLKERLKGQIIILRQKKHIILK